MVYIIIVKIASSKSDSDSVLIVKIVSSKSDSDPVFTGVSTVPSY